MNKYYKPYGRGIELDQTQLSAGYTMRLLRFLWSLKFRSQTNISMSMTLGFATRLHELTAFKSETNNIHGNK